MGSDFYFYLYVLVVLAMYIGMVLPLMLFARDIERRTWELMGQILWSELRLGKWYRGTHEEE